jgi:phosphate transport system protein
MIRAFEADLEKLRTRMIRMGSLVEEQLNFAVRAILEDRRELALIVLERDDKIDKLDIKIDKQCQKIFALHQPVAGDLRLLLTALKMNSSLERMGDLAFNIARSYTEHPDLHALAHRITFERLSENVAKMVTWSLNSFINSEPDLATNIIRSDTQIDAIEREMVQLVTSLMKEDSELIELGIQMILILRSLERIADQTTNIAENVIFLVKSRFRQQGPTRQTSEHTDEESSLTTLQNTSTTNDAEELFE